ncbi:helix-turn-helix domain-containing protein [Caldibacillus lycopersici]|uniref:Helix-turn-helix domain-containing protein n=1 Tax=Perspicuibacillus lycopersici TaxID=1325689 RepID=A0AAE3IRN6_9BACI|nr:helix-turn-helix domain-containing protein [Perspicuibacillus lycopersici]MCU9613177.1 helix-turn-helix domain-containing protein [Perspicuibacillus lycopersici]
MSIGDRIRKRRKELRLIQAELAERVNVSTQVVSNWERGYTEPSHDDVARLAVALICSTDYLHGRDNGIHDLPKLNVQDERDIAIELESILKSLDCKDRRAHYDGQWSEKDEDIELLKSSLETSIRIAKQIAKRKSTKGYNY